MRYFSEGGTEENRPKATLQTYVLVKYNGDMQKIISGEFESWRNTMLDCLKKYMVTLYKWCRQRR